MQLWFLMIATCWIITLRARADRLSIVWQTYAQIIVGRKGFVQGM